MQTNIHMDMNEKHKSNGKCYVKKRRRRRRSCKRKADNKEKRNMQSTMKKIKIKQKTNNKQSSKSTSIRSSSCTVVSILPIWIRLFFSMFFFVFHYFSFAVSFPTQLRFFLFRQPLCIYLLCLLCNDVFIHSYWNVWCQQRKEKVYYYLFVVYSQSYIDLLIAVCFISYDMMYAMLVGKVLCVCLCTYPNVHVQEFSFSSILGSCSCTMYIHRCEHGRTLY